MSFIDANSNKVFNKKMKGSHALATIVSHLYRNSGSGMFEWKSHLLGVDPFFLCCT